MLNKTLFSIAVACGGGVLAAAALAEPPAPAKTASAAIAPSQPPTAPSTPAQGAAAPNASGHAAAASQGSTLHLPVVRHTLKNGLRVLLSSDRSVPTVAVAVYYDVGSRNEQRGHSGFAHLFEHMMFQGSANVGKGQHFELIMNRGGSPNGTTSEDRTNYFQTLPSNDLALGLFLEADRMRSLAITQQNFENQRQTVMEERRQSVDNRPYMASMLRLNELAYGDYFPYAHSTIGDMQDLRNVPLSAVQEFFNQYYAPNNAVLSLSGDFDPDEALRMVERYFGEIPAHKRPPYAPEALKPQTAERVESMVDPLAELPAFHVAYHIPQDRDPDHYPLELLAIVLGDGESSRLYQKLVKGKELLQEIEVSTDSRRGPDLMSIWAICASGHGGPEARAVIWKELADIADKGVTERELQKAKNRVRSMFVFELETNLPRAMHLAEFEMYDGDANLLNEEAARYLAVSLADVQRVAKQYFAATNRTVLDVIPAKSAAAQPAAPPQAKAPAAKVPAAKAPRAGSKKP
ncbi:MAG: M16 family metallopeptidase [Polyangiales bacterium]